MYKNFLSVSTAANALNIPLPSLPTTLTEELILESTAAQRQAEAEAAAAAAAAAAASAAATANSGGAEVAATAIGMYVL